MSKFAVEQALFNGEWSDHWTVTDSEGERPERFDSAADAQAAIAEFLADIQAEIDSGERAADEGYSPDEFRVVEVGK